jgi:2-isopropylmalate synthase
MDKVIIFDTTLRDGEQAAGSSLNVQEKLEIAKHLERMGVDVIEAGFPISSPGDFEAVRTIACETKQSTVCGLARAVTADIDVAWNAVKEAKQPRIHVFISASDIHLMHQLKKSREQVHEMAVAMVTHAKKHTSDIEFSPMDASRSNPDFIYRLLTDVIDAGATTVNIPDTVGYAIPEEFGNFITKIFENVANIHKAVVSVHCHNDLGLAVANSLQAVRCGARQVSAP